MKGSVGNSVLFEISRSFKGNVVCIRVYKLLPQIPHEANVSYSFLEKDSLAAISVLAELEALLKQTKSTHVDSS